MTDTLVSLTREYEAWNRANHLSLGSADEHVFDIALTVEQRAWLRDFCDRWEEAAKRDYDEWRAKQP